VDIKHITGTRQLGLAAAALLALGVVAAAPAANAADAPSASASVTNGTLTINGTGGHDDITLALASDPTQLLVDFGNGAVPQSFNRATFTNISAFLGRGHDTFAVNGTNGAVTIPMTVDGGAGNDTITSGAADDVLIGGRGDDRILGGDGNDLIFGGRGNDFVDGERGTDTEILGAGKDIAQWLPGEGNDNIDGGSGHDTLVFDGANANEKFVASAAGPHAIFTRDVGNIRMDLNNVEALDLAAFGGTDTVTVGDLSGTDLDQAAIDLGAVRGGASDGLLDTVTVDGTNNPDQVHVTADGSAVDVNGVHAGVHITGADTRDQLQLNTGEGNDKVSVSDAAQALITVGVDLGTDQR
jgi:RTX calcium-binding nonapeptide repeat (4 copies)